MVFFDKEGIVKTDAVIVAATAGDSVFLGCAQTGNGFAGIEQFDLGVGHLLGVMVANGRCA